MLRLTRCCALYFMVLALVYVFQTVVSYAFLNPKSFEGYISNEHYRAEAYSFVESICIMNIVHGLTLLSLAFFVILSTRKFKILNESHYMQLFCLTVVITIVYFIPILYIGGRCYYDV